MTMQLCMLLPPKPDRRWALARQMGITHAITKCAPELTGEDPPHVPGVLERTVRRFADAGFSVIGLEGDQFDYSAFKLGLPGREAALENYRIMLAQAGRLGIGFICQNFMCGTGWFRTDTEVQGRGGAVTSRFVAADAAKALPSGEPRDAAAIWANLEAFLRAVLPAAERAGVDIALHPDDPPVPSLRGVARVLTSAAALERACTLVPSPAAKITFCQGTLSTAGEDLVAAVGRLAPRIRFIHVRDVQGNRDAFTETFPDEGQTDMVALFQAYAAAGLDVPIRPDHAPTMAGDAHGTLGTGGGIAVGYEATGMVYTVGWMRGLMRATGLG